MMFNTRNVYRDFHRFITYFVNEAQYNPFILTIILLGF